jgi:transmembrane sensor
MTNVYPLNSDDAMFEQASLWIAKIDRQLTSGEQQAFKKWLAQNQQHQLLIIEMASMWDKMDALNSLADLFPENHRAVATKKTSRIKKWSMALAATITLVLFAGIFADHGVNNLFDDEQAFVRYQTAVGENSTIYLPDNSKVLLNTDSILLVRYTNDYRLLELQRGELLVEVAHDKSRPLSVVANGQVIQAVGTAFNVQLSAQKIELIVTDGKVLVSQIAPEQKVTAKTLKIPVSSLAVSKGEIASLRTKDNDNDNKKVRKIAQEAIQENLSWRHGHIVFKGESLAEVMAEVSRYTSVKFEIADEELKNIKIAGRFKTGDVTGLIGALNNNFNIKTDRVNKNLVVLRKQS